MINSRSNFAWLVMSFLLFFSIEAFSADAVTAPVAANNILAGSTYNITWTITTTPAGNVTIKYSPSGTFPNADNVTLTTGTIAVGIGTYSWTVPSTVSTGCKIQIVDGTPTTIVSGAFNVVTSPTLTGPTATLASLTPAITWGAVTNATGYDYQISTASDFSAIVYSTSVGAVVTSNVPASTLINNTIYYVRIRAQAATAITGAWSSTWQFSTTPIITFPSGGAALVAGNTYNITWGTFGLTGAAGAALIEFAPNGGAYVTVTAAASAQSGTYSWLVPATASASATNTIRITDAAGSTTVLTSNAFTILTANATDLVQVVFANGVNFAWAPVVATTSDIQIGTASDFLSGIVYSASLLSNSTTTLNVSGGLFQNNTKYYWRIKSSPNAWTTTIATGNFWTIPGNANLLLPVADAVDIPLKPTFTWSPVPGMNNYQVIYADNPGFTGGVTSAVLTTNTVTLGSDLIPNFYYYWKVKAYNSANTANFSISDVRKFITASPLTAPTLGTPSALALEVSITPTLAWSGVTNAEGYSIQIAADAAFAAIVYSGTTTEVSNTVLSPLSYNTTYYWRVKATKTNGLDASVWSAVRSFTTKVLSIPVLALPADNAAGVPILPTLSWGAVPVSEGYTVQFATLPDFTTGLVQFSAGNNIKFTVPVGSELSPNLVYYWRVQATKLDGKTSEWSTIRSFTTNMAPPILAYPLDDPSPYVPISYLRVPYKWQSVAGASFYDLQVCKSKSFTTTDLKTYSNIAAVAAMPVITYTPSDFLETGTVYFWRVRVKIGSVTSEYSTPWEFKTGAASTSIPGGDLNATILFDHANGRISQIKYKAAGGGSDKQILNINLNDKNKTGLCRINSETNTKLASWDETTSPNTYVYNYENTLYGAKTDSIVWGTSGIEVYVKLKLDANKQANVNASFMPGGNMTPISDYIMIDSAVTAAGDLKISKYNLNYLSGTTPVYSGKSSLAAIFDTDYSEYFGYKSDSVVSAVIPAGAAFGPVLTYPSKATAQAVNINFSVKPNKNAFFIWATNNTYNNYIAVTAPVARSVVPNNSSQTITWDNFGTLPAVTDIAAIQLSTDGGATFGILLEQGTTPVNAGTTTLTLPDLKAAVYSLTLPQRNCVIKVFGKNASAVSGVFTISDATASTFAIATDLVGSPTNRVTIPIDIASYGGTPIGAFDARVLYDKNILTYVGSSNNLTNWTVGATNNAAGGYVQIGAYQGGGTLISAASAGIVTLVFSINSTARLGTQTSLQINNTYLAASGATGSSLNVAGQDGNLSLFGRVSGFLRYSINKKPIIGNSTISLTDSDNPSNNGLSLTDLNGFFDFSGKRPGGLVTIVPDSTKTYDALAVTATDAALAFAGRDGGPTPLSFAQMIAADVNGDGIVNASDAASILRLSSGSVTPAAITTPALSNWIYVDSSYKLTATNWQTAPRYIQYNPLDSVKAKQSFWGVLRGDVDGSYIPAFLAKPVFEKTAYDSTAVLISVPEKVYALPGDTVYIPVNAALHSKQIGAFNLSLQLDTNFEYTGKCVFGSATKNLGWSMSSFMEPSGRLNIATTDLNGTLDPISTDGTLLVLSYVVKNTAKLGDSYQVQLSRFAVANSKLALLTINSNDGLVSVNKNPTAVENDKNSIVTEYALSQNYPNPFNPSTTISYALPKESKVTIEIFNSLGQSISVLFDGKQSAGHQSAIWNAKNMASGVYFYSIKATSVSDGAKFNSVKKLILMK